MEISRSKPGLLRKGSGVTLAAGRQGRALALDLLLPWTSKQFVTGSPMLPIIESFPMSLTDHSDRMVRTYAKRLLSQPSFQGDASLLEFLPKTIVDGKSLVIDDFSDVARYHCGINYLEQRARLRAEEGDVVVTASLPDDVFDRFVGIDLGLGEVDWLSPISSVSSSRLALSCWHDRQLRRKLVQKIRLDGLRYVHPHMGNQDVWRLAQLLSSSAHRKVEVIGPPPAVGSWVNNKVEFSRTVSDLLGSRWVPESADAYGYSMLCERVLELSRTHRYLGLKVPYGCGGKGNIFLDTEPLQDMSLRQIDMHLRMLIPESFWPDDVPMLIDAWETSVLESASIQTWIPPIADGPPVIEGIFSQMIQGAQGQFVGCVPLQLPDDLESQLIEATSVLTQLYQYMNYVGRCSFDFLVLGDNLNEARIEFIECNGRWGGTSVPMTTVNRMFPNRSPRPFAAISTDDVFPVSLELSHVVRSMNDVIYQSHDSTGQRWLIPFNPNRIQALGGLNWIVLGDDLHQVRQRVDHELPRRIRALVCEQASKHIEDPKAKVKGASL